MKNFWSAFLGSMLAIMVTCGVSIFIFIISIISLTSSIVKSFEPKDDTNITVSTSRGVGLVMDFANPVMESKMSNPMMLFNLQDFTLSRNITALEYVIAINNATADPDIRSITLKLSNGVGGLDMANCSEIREALQAFRNEGKTVYAYSDYYTQSSYYLASVANHIALCPAGGMEWKGVSSVSTYFTGTLDKLDIDVEIFKHGKYKSAVEPFFLKKMSPESREQTTSVINNMWGNITSSVSSSMDINNDKLNYIANNTPLLSPSEALELGLVHELGYYCDTEEITDYPTISFENYAISVSTQNQLSTNNNKIEVIYAEGSIISGEETMGTVGDVSLIKKLQKATKDRSVKAIVLRVNSPGGSALASDVINKAVLEAKKVKPIIVSMGATAASGGYYLAANADAIVASEYTLTGSIGVFGLALDVSKVVKDKVGLSFDVVKTNNHADMGGIHRSMSAKEQFFMQKSVDEVYDTFVNTVASGRDMNYAEVDEVAGGRVWSSSDALRLGLVDKIGGLTDAINLAAHKADLTSDYNILVRTYSTEELFSELFSSISTAKIQELTGLSLGSSVLNNTISSDMKLLENIIKGDKVQALTPIQIKF